MTETPKQEKTQAAGAASDCNDLLGVMNQMAEALEHCQRFTSDIVPSCPAGQDEKEWLQTAMARALARFHETRKTLGENHE